MPVPRGTTLLTVLLVGGLLSTGAPRAQRASTVDADVFHELTWRQLDPAQADGADMLSASADTGFPVNICGVEQQAGPVCLSVAPGSDVGLPSLLPLATTGRVAVPDPADPALVYAGHVVRYDRRTGQTTPLPLPPGADARALADAPLVFAPDGRALYFGANALWRSLTRGETWTAISPDLAGPPAVPAGRTAPAARLPLVTRAAISALGLSRLDARLIWVGTGTGRVHVTRDTGGTWLPVTPSGLGPGAAVRSLEPSHFDVNSAYLVVVDPDSAAPPHVLRTRDGGESWIPITGGLPAGAIHVVREDTLRRGLLFAGTDDGLFVSFDDGERWQPFGLNLPQVPIRDVTISGSDVVAATGGRGYWMLDDISAVRQVTPDVLRAPVFVLRPTVTWRHGASAGNRHAGTAVLQYVVGESLSGPLTLEVLATATGERLRRFSSDLAGDDGLDMTPGLHRKIWNLRYADPGTNPVSGHTIPGARVAPGTYQVRVSTGSRVLRQAITVRMDPRLRIPAADVEAHDELARAVGLKLEALLTAWPTAAEPASLQPGALLPHVTTLGDLALALDAFDGRPTPAMTAVIRAALAAADDALAGAGFASGGPR